MGKAENYLELNRASWNNKTDAHLASDFYDVDGFLKGESSLNSAELELLGDVRGKKILHLQCHFGQDTLSLARMGADITGVDLSDKAIYNAKELAKKLDVNATFIVSDIYDLPNHLNEEFDIVYTSYGTIGWLPDLNKWASVISKFLNPSGKFLFVEFHPVVWMFDDDFKKVAYNYFNSGPIIEKEEGTYADRSADISQEFITWNHGISEVVSSLIDANLNLEFFQEFNYSPYACFKHTEEFEPGKFRIKHLGDKIPMIYSLIARKK